MPQIIFIQPDGTRHVVNANAGSSIMQAAVDNRIAGIGGDCGGCLSCGTCHVHVDPDWFGRLSAPNDMETMMFETVLDLQPHSRLSCQLELTPDLDGLVVRLPAP